MVFTVGICDDNPEQVKLLKQYVESHQSKNEYEIITSSNPVEFWELVKKTRLQIAFLDINMDSMDGINLGDKIKALYKEAVIVYVTAHEKYALEAFRVRAFHYLLKPLKKEKFTQALDEVSDFIRNKNMEKPVKTFTIKTNKKIISLDYSDIYYFEKIHHKIKIHLSNRDICYYDNFTNLVNELESDNFIRCHQGYIANVDMIRGFHSKTLFLHGNIKLPVSRSYIDDIKKILSERLFAGKEEK